MLFATIGAIVLRYAPDIQKSHAAKLELSSRLTRVLSFYDFVRSPEYPVALKVIGGMSMIAACAMLWAAYR